MKKTLAIVLVTILSMMVMASAAITSPTLDITFETSAEGFIFEVDDSESAVEAAAEELAQDARVTTLLVRSGLCKSQSVARQQIEQNAVSLDGEKVTDPVAAVSVDQVSQGLLLKKGKKGFCRVVLK